LLNPIVLPPRNVRRCSLGAGDGKGNVTAHHPAMHYARYAACPCGASDMEGEA
jgi:hypothetical protein